MSASPFEMASTTSVILPTIANIKISPTMTDTYFLILSFGTIISANIAKSINNAIFFIYALNAENIPVSLPFYTASINAVTVINIISVVKTSPVRIPA
ncbi:hypothetical protein SDC9_143825 [bioreactor metagenome]|uniref:Uncharacterized protein n=1 Tax=bioreactor metagenome TaxID=1076179 RepID=A0A645E4G0_9ZZZZ